MFDNHVKDYRRIEENAQLILISALARVDSKPTKTCFPFGFHVRVSESVAENEIYFIPQTDSLIHIYEQDPMEDLRKYFGVIKNVTF